MKTYHIFTDNKDYYTDKLKEAKKIFKELVSDYGNARLYELIEYERQGEIEENCLMSKGDYPY